MRYAGRALLSKNIHYVKGDDKFDYAITTRDIWRILPDDGFGVAQWTRGKKWKTITNPELRKRIIACAWPMVLEDT